MWKFLYLLFFLGLPFLLCAQDTQLTVQEIFIEGNKKTKDRIILRELDFVIGDSIPLTQLSQIIEKNRLQVLNTGLFTQVQINVKDWDTESNELSILLTVTESWYIYPFPVFELAERNFNVWWSEQNRSLDRINYGLRFYYLNISGRRDLLKLVTQFGYTQKYELAYRLPFFNKAQNLGFSTEMLYARNKEVAYQTIDNKLAFNRSEEDFLLQRFRAGVGLNYRPAIFARHQLKINFQQNKITDFVATELNPDFLLNGRRQQRFFSLIYNFIYDRRDIQAYPLAGNYLAAQFRQRGLGIYQDINDASISLGGAQYFATATKRWSLGFIAKARVAIARQKQAYYNTRALGYNDDYIRGYELYVIDGIDYLYLKTSLRYQLWNRPFNFGKYMPLKALRVMPLKVYLTINSDIAYVNDPYYATTNPLTNEMLWGGGLGLDFVLYYDKVIQIEYSRNHLNEFGLFLHFKLSF